MHLRRFAVLVGPAAFLACQPSVKSVTIEPASIALAVKGETKPLKATPLDGKGALAVEALTRISWTSSDSSVASVVNGNVTAIRSGDADITAAVSDVQAVARIKVSIPAKISLEPSEIEIVGVGKTAPIAPKVKDEIGREIPEPLVAWSTGTSTVAMVVDGKIEAKGAGVTHISASINGLTSAARVAVRHPAVARIEISPVQPKLERAGDAVRLTATLFDAEGEPIRGVPVTWSSSADSIATVSQEGLVMALKKGRAKIAASAMDQSSEIEITLK